MFPVLLEESVYKGRRCRGQPCSFTHTQSSTKAAFLYFSESSFLSPFSCHPDPFSWVVEVLTGQLFPSCVLRESDLVLPAYTAVLAFLVFPSQALTRFPSTPHCLCVSLLSSTPVRPACSFIRHCCLDFWRDYRFCPKPAHLFSYLLLLCLLLVTHELRLSDPLCSVSYSIFIPTALATLVVTARNTPLSIQVYVWLL